MNDESPTFPASQAAQAGFSNINVKSSANVPSRLAANAGRYLGRVSDVGYLDHWSVAGCCFPVQQDSNSALEFRPVSIKFNLAFRITLIRPCRDISSDCFVLFRISTPCSNKVLMILRQRTRRQTPCARCCPCGKGESELPDRPALGAKE